MSKFVSIGKIVNFHGIKGEAKVGFTKNQQEFLLSLKEVFVKKRDDNDYSSLIIEKVKIQKNFAIIKFQSINSVNELLPLKGLVLFVEEDTVRQNLGEDEFLIDELIGLDVFDTENKKVGFVVGVSNNGASDLLSVKTQTNHISLVPFVKAIVVDVKLKDKSVIINNIEGLLE